MAIAGYTITVILLNNKVIIFDCSYHCSCSLKTCDIPTVPLTPIVYITSIDIHCDNSINISNRRFDVPLHYFDSQGLVSNATYDCWFYPYTIEKLPVSVASYKEYNCLWVIGIWGVLFTFTIMLWSCFGKQPMFWCMAYMRILDEIEEIEEGNHAYIMMPISTS
jgi:hypothetical protein